MANTNKYTRALLPHLLLISGSGRNCGKTTLACEIIKNISANAQVIALKISPHFHLLSDKQALLFEDPNLKIYRELDETTEKDSARMLKSGATHVYYVQCEDNYLPSAWHQVSKILPINSPVVCESGSLGLVYKAGLHLLVEGRNTDKMKRSYLNNRNLSDRIMHFDGRKFSVDIANICFKEKQWILNNKQDDQIRRSA